MSWPKLPLDQLGYVSRGRSRHRPRNDPTLYGGPYPFIQTGDVKHANFRITEHTATYSEAGLAQSRLWPKDTLCITIAANIADTALLAYEACFPDSVIGFIANKEKADPRFVKYYFDIIQRELQMVSQGATQDNLSQEKLLSFGIACPPVEVQRQVAEVLSAYDDLIATNQRRIALLEDAARRLYREWFVYLHFPGYELVSLVDGVPEGWSKLPLGSIADITMGQSPESKFFNTDGDGLPFHQGVSDFGHRFVTHEKFTKQSTRIAEAGDILCSVRAPVGRLNVTRDRIAIGRGLSAMRSCFGHQSLLFYQLDALFVEEDMIGGGAIFASVGKKELFSQLILQPSQQVASEFNRVASDIDGQIETLDSQNRSLIQARDLLLPKLMSGQLDVSGIALPDEVVA
jgi:type I restriction enzyme S subunit